MSAVRTLAAALGAGLTLNRALLLAGDLGEHRAIVDDILSFAIHTGVPRAEVLTALAESIDESERRERALMTGTASARQTTNLLVALPALTALGAQFIGFDVLSVLVGSWFGLACLGIGCALSAAVWWWMGRIRHGVFRPALNSGLVITLAAGIARTSGLTESHRETLRRLAMQWGTSADCDAIDSYRALSHESGVPVSRLLELESRLLSERLRARVLTEIELLPGRLLIPIGVCLLPSFVVTTVIPVVVTMVGNATR